MPCGKTIRSIGWWPKEKGRRVVTDGFCKHWAEKDIAYTDWSAENKKKIYNNEGDETSKYQTDFLKI